MKSKKIELALEWLLVALMTGVVMYLGWSRAHQLNINRFLLIGYGAILALVLIFRVVSEFFLKNGESDGNADDTDA